MSIAIFTLLLNNLAFSQINEELTLSKEQATEDIQYYFETIKNVHPSPFYYSSERLLDSISYNIITKLSDSLTAVDLMKLLEYQTNNIFDGHTGIPLYSYPLKVIPENSFLFPFEIYIEKEKVYFKNMDSIQQICKINNTNISEITNEMRKLLKADFPKSVRGYYIKEYFKQFYHSLYGSYETFVIDCADNEHINTVSFKGVKKQELEDNSDTQDKDKDYSLEIFLEDSIALLTVNTFKLENETVFKKFLCESFYSISKSKIPTLFIDIRENSGGVR